MQTLYILSITVAIYLLIALGYLAGRRGGFTKPEMRLLGRFVIQLVLPLLVFQALAQRKFMEILNAEYLLAYALASLLLATLQSLVTISVWLCHVAQRGFLWPVRLPATG